MSPQAEPVIVIQESEGPTLKGLFTASRPFSDDRLRLVARRVRAWGRTRPEPARTDSTLDLTADGARTLDRRLAIAVCCVDVLRIRNEE